MEGKILILLACIVLAQCEWVKEMENVGAFEGDIILDPDENENLTSNSYASIYGGRWPEARIPYVIHRSIASGGKAAIRKAIAQYEKYTCIRFIPKTGESAHINFYKGLGCFSPIGYRRGRTNYVSLASGCWTTGIAMHEIAHSLGLWHEQSRPDRDKYVTIKWKNIPAVYWINFKKQRTTSLGTPYDFRSMMHYGSTAFGRGGRRTILTKDPIYQRIIGQRRGFSRIDVKQINRMYCDESAACRNTNSICDEWQQRGKCENTFWIHWMSKNCRKACKLC